MSTADRPLALVIPNDEHPPFRAPFGPARLYDDVLAGAVGADDETDVDATMRIGTPWGEIVAYVAGDLALPKLPTNPRALALLHSFGYQGPAVCGVVVIVGAAEAGGWNTSCPAGVSDRLSAMLHAASGNLP